MTSELQEAVTKERRIEMAVEMLRLFGNPIVEIRTLPPPVERGYFDDLDAAARQAIEQSDLQRNVYVTISEQCDHVAGLADNKIGKGASTKDADIAKYTNLVLDIDPVRAESGLAATDNEHAAARRVGAAAMALAAEMGWPEPLFVDSGNGCYVIFAIDLENTKANHDLVGRVLHAFAQKVDCPVAKVDTSVGNASRIFRVAGTINRKGEATDERPHRMATIISRPTGHLVEVTAEQLAAFAGPEAPPSPGVFASIIQTPQQHQTIVDGVVTTLRELGLSPTKIEKEPTFTLVSLPHCSKGDSDGNTGVLVWRSGGIQYKCFHDKCQGMTWADFQNAMNPSVGDLAAEAVAKELLGEGLNGRTLDDPLVLAKVQMKKWATTKGEKTLAFFSGQTYRYNASEGWEPIRQVDVEPFIRQTIQDVYDRYAEKKRLLTGQLVTSQKVTGQKLTDTYKAMQSLCTHEVSRTAQAPFWLTPHTWNADDLHVFRNGILNVRRYISAEPDFFIARTPKLFFEQSANFDFAMVAPEPTEWKKFLASLGQDAEWHRCLQQIVGYCLWRGYDLQKFFMLAGPPRSGKGTIVKVLTDLLGGSLAVCSPGFADFHSDFGLEQAIGKCLAIVPEATLPKNHAKDIVSRIKAWTGGDSITVHRKNKVNLSMCLKRTRIIVQTNDVVALPDNSGALHARMIPMKLTKSFTGSERADLADSLVPEYPGIMLWALEGLKDLRTTGKFALPPSSLDLLDSLNSASAPLKAFVDDCCELDPTAAVQKKALHEIYRHWMEEERQDQQKYDSSQFAIELASVLPTLKDRRLGTAGAKTYAGYTLAKTDYDDKSGRSYIWLGIRPRPEWASKLFLRPKSIATEDATHLAQCA
jgi:putative DNA primase/helicase